MAVEELPPSPIRPALDTLRALDDGMFLDKLAVAIHDAVSAVQHLGKGAKVNVCIAFAPLTKQGLSEPVITAEVELNTKLPQPDPHRTMFFIDVDGNPTTKQQRQAGLNFSVAGEQGVKTT